MGHMNVQFYVAHADAGIAHLASTLGLRSPEHYARGVLVPREQHIRYQRELRPGAPFVIRGGILSARSEGFIFYQEMVNPVTDAVAATFVTRSEWCDAEYRGGLPVPAEAVGRAASLAMELPAHGAPRGLELHAPRPAPTLADAEALGMVTTLRGTILEVECDSQGFVLPRHYIGRISDSIPNLLAQTSGADRSSGRIGGAALEYRLLYRKAAVSGDLIILKSGLKSVGAKTYAWCHWLFDAETGECIVTSEAVAISLDLVERKAIAIPPDLRAHLESLVIPGLSV